MKKNLIIALLFYCASVAEITFAKHDNKKITRSHVSQDNKKSIELLNKLLANESVLLMQTLNYHWNLTGPEFHDYHLLFDKQYNQLFADMDKIAERVRAVQGHALGSFKNILGSATVKEDNGPAPKPKQMVANLIKQYKTLIAEIKNAIKELSENSQDFGTVNFLEELITQHEKTAWMLRSLTEK